MLRDDPPPKLVALLQRLRLATPEQTRAVRRRVRRLLGDLPDFDSVWIDALAQTGRLTPLQAEELHEGRADRLLVGPYILCEERCRVGIGEAYAARSLETGELVYLLLVRPQGDPAAALAALQSLIPKFAKLSSPRVHAPRVAGVHSEGIWVAGDPVTGKSAADWMSPNGRFSGAAALEIARQMAATLAELEQAGLVHGDVSADHLWLTAEGRCVMPLAGVRGVVRPHEGFGHADAPPEAFDNLAPERIALGTPPTIASDLFACGCLWRRLLVGRPTLPGGNSLAKLRAAQSAQIADVRDFVWNAPEALLVAIDACLQSDPQRRPASFAELAQKLGPPTRGGRRAVVRTLRHVDEPLIQLLRKAPASQRAGRFPLRTVAAAAGVLLVAMFVWRGLPGRAPLMSIRGGPPSGRQPRPEMHAKPAPKLASKAPPAAPVKLTEPASRELLLPADRPTHWRDVRLNEGLTIRGDGGRAWLLAPATGILIDREGVRFEDVAFAPAEPAAEARPGALLRVRAMRHRFRALLVPGGIPRSGKSHGRRRLGAAVRRRPGASIADGRTHVRLVRVSRCCVGGSLPWRRRGRDEV